MDIEQLFPDRDEEECDALTEEQSVSEYYYTMYVGMRRRQQEFEKMMKPENRTN
jgi:hypothetical protein